MMGKVVFVLVCMVAFSCKAWPKDTPKKDPFVPPFVRAEESNRSSLSSARKVEVPRADLEIEVQGIIMGSKFKQAIIDDELYKEGDTLKNIDARIVKIEKGIVSIMFEGVLYEKVVENIEIIKEVKE